MAILDAVCFERNDYILEIPIFDIKSPMKTEVFVLDANVSVGFYYRLLVANEKMKTLQDDTAITQLLKDMAIDTLNLDKSKHITALDIEYRFNNAELLNDLYYVACLLCQNLSRPDLFSVPDIQVKEEKEDTKKIEQKARINRLQKLIDESGYSELMEGIVYVTMETHNNYQDVMNMPFMVFQAFLKHIKILNSISVPEWREGYLQEKYKLYKLADYESSHNEEKPKQTANVDEIRRFMAGL